MSSYVHVSPRDSAWAHGAHFGAGTINPEAHGGRFPTLMEKDTHQDARSPEGVSIFSSLACFILIATLKGRVVRVVVLGICCDHPALCKACGFADCNRAGTFCFKYAAPRADLNSADAPRIGHT